MKQPILEVCNRSFRHTWNDDTGYSHRLDAAFCIYCALFANEGERPHRGKLVNYPFEKMAQEDRNSEY